MKINLFKNSEDKNPENNDQVKTSDDNTQKTDFEVLGEEVTADLTEEDFDTKEENNKNHLKEWKIQVNISVWIKGEGRFIESLCVFNGPKNLNNRGFLAFI